MSEERLRGERLALVEAVDHLLDRGAVLSGEATISVAGVDLVYLGLNVLLASVETLRPGSGGVAFPSGPSGGGGAPGAVWAPEDRPRAAGRAEDGRETAGLFAGGAAGVAIGNPEAGRPDQGLAQLVLTLVELLRRVVEHQALRRAEGGGLSDEEVERMGVALMGLESKMEELREVFGLSEADLDVDLGPLGRLLS